MPTLLMAVATLALATWVIGIRPKDRLHRAFAFFLLVRGAFYLLVALDSSADSLLFRIARYYGIAIPFAALWFARVFHSHYARKKYEEPRRFDPVLALIGFAGFAAIGWYAIDHDMMIGSWPAESFIFHFSYLSYAFVGYILAREFATGPAGAHRSAMYLLSLGFIVDPIFRASRILPQFVFDYDLLRWQDKPTYAILLGCLVLAALAIQKVVNSPHARAKESGGSTGYWVTSAAAAATGLGVYSLARYAPRDLWAAVQFTVEGFWLLLLVFLAAYSILRCRLFGVELSAKTLVTGSTIAAPFALTLFWLGESLQDWAQNTFAVNSYWIGLGAAGLISLAFWPLRRVGSTLAERLFPGVADTDEYRARRKEQMYLAAVEDAVEDKIITDRERVMLESVRDHLHLSPQQAKGLEKAVMMSVLSVART